jgi:hypothetical protein
LRIGPAISQRRAQLFQSRVGSRSNQHGRDNRSRVQVVAGESPSTPSGRALTVSSQL